MGIERIGLGAVVLLTLAGVLTSLAVLFAWDKVRRWPLARTSVTIIAIMRAVAALSAIWAASRSPNQDRNSIRIACVACWLIWELAGILIGWRSDRQKKFDSDVIEGLEDRIEQLRAEAAEFRDQRHFLNRLIAAIRDTVLDKSRRIRDVLAARDETSRIGIALVRETLDPEEQAYLTLERMGAFLRESIAHLDRVNTQTFRIGLYVARDGTMKPALSWDVSRRRAANFSSSEKYPDRFALDSTDPSCVVRCVRDGTLLVVPDCVAVPGFHFDDKQRVYLKSLIAFPIMPYGRDDLEFVAAIVIDTNEAGHFQEKDRELYRIYMEEFAVRLDLEYLFSQLFGQG